VTWERSSVMLSFIFWTRVTTSQVLCTSCTNAIVFRTMNIFLQGLSGSRVKLALLVNVSAAKIGGIRVILGSLIRI
jgi:hypothetical protein